MLEPTPQRPLILFAGVLALITAGIVLVWLVIIFLHFRHIKILPVIVMNNPSVFIGSTQTGPLYTITLNASSSPVLFQPSGTGTSTIVDAVTEASTTYFIMYDRSTLSSNLYEITLNTPQPKIQQLTTSTTTKWHLGYDAPSHTFVYEAASVSKKTGIVSGSMVTVFNSTTGIEKSIGSGANPTLLPGGIMIVAANKGKIMVINDVTGLQTPILSASNPLFAVSPNGKTLVTYNSVSKTLDSYSLQGVTSTSYQQSESAPLFPLVMTYVGNKVLVAGETQTASTTVQLQFVGEKAPVGMFGIASVDMFPDFIAALHS